MTMKSAFEKAGIKSGGNPKSKTEEIPTIKFRENDRLRRELLTVDAQKWADLLAQKGNGVTPTQLRNFFNEVKALESRIEAGGFEKVDALIGLLKSKAAYTYARAEKKKKEGFKYLQYMIEQCVDYSTSKERFRDFVLFFEAVMGFFKGR